MSLIIVDYLAFSSKLLNLADLKCMLKLNECDFIAGKGKNGWSSCDYSNGIRLFYGLREDIAIEMSGSGCRFLETCNDNKLDWLKLLKFLQDNKEDNINVSRLDIACDDKSNLLPMESIINQAQNDNYISRSRRCICTSKDEEQVIFGAPSSDTRLRIYNKALERKVNEHWIRVEFQFRNESADNFIHHFCEHEDIGYAFSGVLNNYLRFTEGNPDDTNRHYENLITSPWWAEFVQSSAKLKNIKAVGMEYNLESLFDYIKGQVAPSLKAFIQASGGDIMPLMEIITGSKLSKKQRELVKNEINFANFA